MVQYSKKMAIIGAYLAAFFIIFSTTAFADDDASANQSPISYSNACTRDQNPNEFTILSYHEVAESTETLDSTYTVSPANFSEQMQWLNEHGYHFISVNDILAHRLKHQPLPDKAVLVTFDDGYRSTYDNAFPILKKYHIPFVVAMVGSWLKPTSGNIMYGNQPVDRKNFLTQAQIKEMLQTGLMEVGSHSYDLHHGVVGNPQGNTQPAATTRIWSNNHYENERNYAQRIYQDLKQNNDFLEKYTGQRPRVMVWPYGRYNIETRQIAEKLGMPVALTLDDGSNTEHTPLWGLRRVLVEKDFSTAALENEMQLRNANYTDQDRTTKAAHVDLDYIYDPDPEQENANVGALLDRLQKLGVNTVYLQAFSDPDADGAADAVYFPNPYLPVRHDLFNRVAWQIVTRTPVTRVYAWMPMLAWELPKNNPVSKQTVVALGKDGSHLNMGYPRLSPFSPQVRKMVEGMYQSLARYSTIDGILFHDDVTLSDYEDDSQWGRAQNKRWGLPDTVAKIRANPTAFKQWTALKTKYLDDFAMHLSDMVNAEQPGLKTARNLYAQVVLNPNAQEWYAQSLPESLKRYDYTAIMAMPYMEQADNPQQFYQDLVSKVKAQPCGLDKSVIELQTVNWRKNDQPISTDEFDKTIHDLYGMGVQHVAYYPDDLYNNNPNQEHLRKVFAEKAPRVHSNH